MIKTKLRLIRAILKGEPVAYKLRVIQGELHLSSTSAIVECVFIHNDILAIDGEYVFKPITFDRKETRYEYK